MKSTKLTLQQVMQLHEGLELALDSEIKDFKLSYWIGRLHEKTGQLKKHFERTRTGLFKEYGEQKEGGNYEVPKAKQQAFFDALEGVLLQEEELRVPEWKLSQFEGEELKPMFYSRVGTIIEDDLFEEEEAPKPKRNTKKK